MIIENKRFVLILIGFLFGLAFLWHYFIAPFLTILPADFSYNANIVSSDNFYDEGKKEYAGEKQSATNFSYEVVDQKQGIYIIKNIFNVRTFTGDEIFKVERLYGIDPKNRAQVAGFGDHDRAGYLFAPQHLKKGAPFTYWHINYDGGAVMNFVDEENIFGLPVYHYETHYKGVKIDQTKDLTYLPKVGITRGIDLEPYLQVWIEPETGRMIKYKDETVAYYYDLKTGVKQNPWNKFSNTYTRESVFEQVNDAKKEKIYFRLVENGVPVFILLSVLFLFVSFFNKKIAIAIFILVDFIIYLFFF